MTGDQIISMLEWSVFRLGNRTSTGNLYGAFLQYSGLQVIHAKRKKKDLTDIKYKFIYSNKTDLIRITYKRFYIINFVHLDL